MIRIAMNDMKWRYMLRCSICLLALLQGCRGKPEETFTEIPSGNYKIVIRTQEFHHSGSVNADLCIAHQPDGKFPAEKLQCFLQGYDFSDLTGSWRSPTEVVISYRCGRVTDFRNTADVYGQGPAPEEFYVFLNDSCTPHDRFGDVRK